VCLFADLLVLGFDGVDVLLKLRESIISSYFIKGSYVKSGTAKLLVIAVGLECQVIIVFSYL
jgi:hypothetical protein